MRHTSYIILLIAVIGISTLGFLGVGLMDHSSSQLCPFLGATCPPTSNAISVALHHFSGLQSLSEANIGEIGALSILLLLLVVFIKTQEPTTPKIRFAQPQSREIIVIPYIRQLLFWCTLHNKRDPHVAVLVRSET